MKKISIIIVLLFFSFAIKAQEVKDSIPKSYNLTGPQYSTWTNFYNNWRVVEYPKILKENKLKMNCSGCESIYMDVIFTINEIGKLSNYRIIRSKKCGKEFSKKLENRFMRSFMDFQFPKDMRNLKFEVKLGTGLKC